MWGSVPSVISGVLWAGLGAYPPPVSGGCWRMFGELFSQVSSSFLVDLHFLFCNQGLGLAFLV